MTVCDQCGRPSKVDTPMGQNWPAAYEELRLKYERLRTALKSISGFGSIDLVGEWEGGLRDIIRSMTDCAKCALEQEVPK